MRIRREPPAFRQLAVARTERLTARMMRVTLHGEELDGFVLDQPAASVRLLLPQPGDHELTMPAWTGNEFLLPSGERPAIRTLTPRRYDAARRELDVDVVLHGQGAASRWAGEAAPGDRVAVSGPGRGYLVPDAATFLLVGDETALPAIGQLLEALPHAANVNVLVEVASPEARFALPDHPSAEVSWLESNSNDAPGDRLVDAVTQASLEPGTVIWAAGEAAAMQRLRRHLFEERGLSRREATVRGYWKHGRSATGGDADDADG